MEAKEYIAKRTFIRPREDAGATGNMPRKIAMFRLDADKPAHFCDGVSRRDFLHAGSLGFLGLTMPHFFRLKAHGGGGSPAKM